LKIRWARRNRDHGPTIAMLPPQDIAGAAWLFAMWRRTAFGPARPRYRRIGVGAVPRSPVWPCLGFWRGRLPARRPVFLRCLEIKFQGCRLHAPNIA
jgi:hypothetical protein